MPEILHRSSLITRSEWTPTFFDLTEDANSSSSPKRLPYCQYRILFSLLLWLCLSSTYPLGGKWRDKKSSPLHPQLEAGHSTSTQASAQQHQPLTTAQQMWSHRWIRSRPAPPSQDLLPSHFGNNRFKCDIYWKLAYLDGAQVGKFILNKLYGINF